MTSQLTAKIRLVKCPRCHRVLPELSNVPVYQCGGCDAVLQVKKRDKGTNDTGLHIDEAYGNQKNELQNYSEETETRDEEKSVEKISETGHKETRVGGGHWSKYMNGFSSGRESFEGAMEEAEVDLDKFLFKHTNLEDQDGKGSKGLSSPDEIDSLTEFGDHESKEPSPISIARCNWQENDHQNKESSPVCKAYDEVAEKGNGLEKHNGSNRVSPSNDLSCHEIENLSPETETSSEFDEDAISRYIFGDFKKEKLLSMDPPDSVVTPHNLSRESASTENLSPPHIEPSEQYQPREATEVEPRASEENQNLHNQVLPLNELNCQELEDSSPIVGTQNESKQSSLSLFVFGNLKKEKSVCMIPVGSAINSPKLAGESRLEKDSLSPYKEQPHSRKSSRSDSVSSEETLENIDFTNADSTNRRNHAYDGSESLLGKTDDHDHDQYLRLLKGKSTEAESSQVKALPTSSYLDSFSRDKNAYATKGFSQFQDQLLEPTGHGRPVRRWTQFKSDERISRSHFRPWVSPKGNEYGSFSNCVENQFRFTIGADFPPKLQDPEEEKLKLKKMVLELQDQLNRSRTPEGYASCGLNHNGYLNRCYQREDFSDHYKCACIPFSAEAAVSRPQMGHSCLQYSPHDWHCSAPLKCTAYSNYNHYNIHCPCSDFSMKNCENMRTNEGGKHTPRGKYMLKKHIIPVKGGAPFVVCDQCSNLLQFPADFLLFKKRYHRLRCGSCSYVLKFSLRNGYRFDRYTDNNESGDLAPAPPPSEVDDLRDTNKGKKISNEGNCPHVDSMCISEDYGPSVCRSCSTEGEPLSVVLPYDVQKKDLNRKKTISGGSIDHLNSRKNQSQQSVPKESQNIYATRISKVEKSSPEIERPRGRDVSPLHRLMGYNSAREVLN